MNALVLAAALLVQIPTRIDAQDRLAEAYRLRDLALFDKAEEILRSFIKAAPPESQISKTIPEFRAALCEVLLGARKYEELKAEAETLRRHPRTKHQGLSLLAAWAWHTGQVAEAAKLLDEADKAAADPAAFMAPESLRRLHMIRGVLPWKRFETATHIVHHPADSPIAAAPAAFGKRLDAAFERVRAELDVRFEGKIEAFFFNNQAQADAIVEQPLGVGLPAWRSYYTRADGPPGFAIAQVLSFHVANRSERRPPGLPGLSEGYYATHADDARWDRRRREIPRQLLKGGDLEDLSVLLAQPPGNGDTFAVVGSFVQWLIKSRGRENFRRLWRKFNDLAIAEGPGPWKAVYGVSLEVLEAEWRSSIK